MEQMIIQYVHACGRIAQREVIDLYRTNGRQATYLLQKLVEHSLLARRGMGRGTTYTRTDKIDK